MVTIVYFIDKGAVSLLVNLDMNFSSQIYNMVRLCIWDILVVYSALMFVKFERIENDLIEEEFRNNQEEQVMMMRATLDNINRAKKPM